MKKFVVKCENEIIKMFDERIEARRWIAKNDKFGDYTLWPMNVHDDGTMEVTSW